MIKTEREERGGVHVSTLWLDRPDKRNALTPGMLTELVVQAESAAQQGDAVLVAGAGPVFCAGFDLAMCQEAPEGTVMRLLLTGLSSTCRALRNLDRPVVIAAHGAAIAGGCALLGGADLVVTDREAKLGYPVVKLGVSPAVSVPFLRQSVPDGAARHRSLRPDLFSADEARAIGLVDRVVDSPDEAIAAARDEAFRLASIPAGAYRATKQWLNTLEGIVQQREDEAGLEASLSLVGGPEERERIGALSFTGRGRGTTGAES